MSCKLKKSWIKSELEHTSDIKLAEKIACDHVKEYGDQYYPNLFKLQRKLKK